MAMEQNSDELIPTRWSRVARLKDLGDQQSWREFFDTYSRLIRGVAIKSGLTEAEAEDVVQETIIRSRRKWRSSRPSHNPARSRRGGFFQKRQIVLREGSWSQCMRKN